MAAVLALAGVGRPGLHPAVHAGSVARDCARVRRAVDAARHGVGGLRGGGPRHPGRHQLHLVARAQALGPDRQQPVHAVAAVGQGAPEPGCPAQADGLREGQRALRVPRSAERVPVRVEEGLDRVRRPRQEADPRETEADPGLRHGGRRVQGQDRAGGGQLGAGSDQRNHQGGHGQGAQGLLHAGPRREGHLGCRAHGIQRHRQAAGARQLQGRAVAARPAGFRARRRGGRRRGRPENGPAVRRGRRAEGLPGQGRQADDARRSPGEAGQPAAHQSLGARPRAGRSTSAATW